MSSGPPAKPSDQTWSDAEEAEQKRFRIMAGGGVLVVLVLAFFALKPSGDTAAPAPTLPETSSEASAVPDSAVAQPEATPAAPSVPGTSGGGGGGGRGGGSPGGGGSSATKAREHETAPSSFTREHGVALGMSPRAAAALADSASGRGGRPTRPTSGHATVARATTMMSEPAAGSILVTVPSGTPLILSGCQPAAGGTWCRATHAGFSGWVRQSDVG